MCLALRRLHRALDGLVADDDSGSKLHRQQQQHMQRIQEQLHKAKQSNGKPGGLDTSIIPDTPENRIALLGLPTLSDTFQVSVRIRESKEFKVGTDALPNRPSRGGVREYKGLSGVESRLPAYVFVVACLRMRPGSRVSSVDGVDCVFMVFAGVGEGTFEPNASPSQSVEFCRHSKRTA